MVDPPWVSPPNMLFLTARNRPENEKPGLP
ncbi:Uncharacterised protein [Mycobacteroides abscessus subsp. abscessus]|nr:Uncharacterised protein [Mycobacteroides abscessus subsp. abscessus]SKV97956.1 Uncharacterised protein [Mycobacteroides abscessus subsp. abscessus]